MGTIEIYYFSGTGNSLHVARELQNRIPEIKLIPILSVLDREIISTDAETIGFVFPTYLTTVPAPVRKFIDKLDLTSSKYIFSITTCIGAMCLANITVEKALKKKGKHLDSSFILIMANNSPTGLKPAADKNWASKITKDKVLKLESEVQAKLDTIKNCILSKQKMLNRSSIFNVFLERIMSPLTKNINKEIPFYSDSSCNSCGLCENVCLAKKVKMVDEKPAWQKGVQCYFCYACFNFCPNQSILVKDKYTFKSGRYFHPSIEANDIVEQKD